MCPGSLCVNGAQPSYVGVVPGEELECVAVATVQSRAPANMRGVVWGAAEKGKRTCERAEGVDAPWQDGDRPRMASFVVRRSDGSRIWDEDLATLLSPLLFSHSARS